MGRLQQRRLKESGPSMTYVLSELVFRRLSNTTLSRAMMASKEWRDAAAGPSFFSST